MSGGGGMEETRRAALHKRNEKEERTNNQRKNSRRTLGPLAPLAIRAACSWKRKKGRSGGVIFRVFINVSELIVFFFSFETS